MREEHGASAVETALEKLSRLEGKIVKLDDVALLSSRQLK
jgi:hypothetical protein